METIVLQIIVFQLCFLVAYEILFRKETFFNWNRGYLLITSIASILLPFIKLKSFSKVIPSEFFVNLPAVILGEEKVASSTILENLDVVAVHTNSITFSVVWIWYVGTLVFGCVLFLKLYKIWRYKQSNNSVQKSGYSITTLKNSEDAFSFLKSIFLGDKIENTQKESILKHEKVHVEEKHTIDLLWFELLRIVFWFNPLVYIYQKRITEVHEFIADKSASKQQKNYYENLLAKTFNIAQFSLVNQFYSSSLIKKRIIMLTKEKSNKTKLVKYITIIPIVVSMLVYVSCSDALEVDNGTEVAVSSETTVLEDVITIINKTPVNKDITKEEFNTILSDLKQYKNTHATKIEQTDFKKYTTLFYNQLENVTTEDYKKVIYKNKDLLHFQLSYISLEKLLDEIDAATYEENSKRWVMLMSLSESEVANRLKELNYILPNEEKYKKTVSSIESQELDKDYSGHTEVPFTVIDQSPIYPGCDENATLEELKKCLSMSIAKHVNEHFDTNIAKNNNLSGRQRISTMFKINKDGMITDIKVRAPHPNLVTETERVLNLLPKMKPGMYEGRIVTVPYSLPIIIQVN